jgi:hypothetical protein
MVHGGIDLWIHVFLALVLVGGEWLASRLGHFTPMVRAPSAHCIGGWVDHRASLDSIIRREILPLPGLNLDPSAIQPVASCYRDYMTIKGVRGALQCSVKSG